MGAVLPSSDRISSVKDILIIDDSEDFRELLKVRLRDFAFASIYETERGEPARLVFFQLRPDLIFLDVNLPDCNGLTMLPQLAAAPWRPRIIVVSAHAHKIDRNRIARMGAMDLIAKPLSREGFRGQMTSYLPLTD